MSQFLVQCGEVSLCQGLNTMRGSVQCGEVSFYVRTRGDVVRGDVARGDTIAPKRLTDYKRSSLLVLSVCYKKVL
jgi:hypothetical protein